MKKFTRLFSIFLIVVGFILVLTSALPILSYEVFTSHDLEVELLSPVPEEQRKEFANLQKDNDLVKISNWFEGTLPELQGNFSGITYYNISIPRLKITNATVEIGGEDLSKNLIHYKGTALPGEKGNTVIFGHSTLPQLFKPDNYLSIFSTLPTIKKGERVFVNYDGITYTYKVEDIFEAKPNQVEILNQKYDDSYISIVTCVPPGTYLRRLVVKGRLVPPGTNL